MKVDYKEMKLRLNGVKDIPTAERWLRMARQRARRDSQVHILCAKFVNDEWIQGMDSPMILTKSNNLMQGQHRIAAWLEAIKLKPDLDITFVVRHDIPDEYAYAAQTDALPVTPKDALLYAGKDGEIGPALKLFVNRGISMGRPRMEVLIAAAGPYQPALQWANKHLDGKKIKTAFAAAAVARALFVTKATKKIERFCEILNGDPPKKSAEQHPAKLARELLSNDSPRATDEVFRAYRKVEHALKQFLDDVPDGKIMAAKTELFPLPGETSVMDDKPAVLIPVYGASGRPVNEVVENLLATGKLSMRKIRWRTVAPRTRACFYSPTSLSLLATATYSRSDRNAKGEPVLMFANAERATGEITPTKLMKLSIARKRIPNLKRMKEEITKITAADVELLMRAD